MLAHEAPVFPGEADNRLELSADGKYAPLRCRQLDRARHVSPGAAQKERAPLEDPYYRVVGTGVNFPVMDQEEVGNLLEPLPRLIVAVSNRFVGDVAARHDQGG